MSTHNIGFYEDLTKIILNYHQLSSNIHPISSAVTQAQKQYAPLTFQSWVWCVNIIEFSRS